MKQLDYMAVAEKAMKQIKKGSFLTVQAGDALNTMTIGWATIGFVWTRPVFMVAVRDSRHTFGVIEKAEDFTVSVPLTDMKDAVMFCGTKSGRDYNKFKETIGFTILNSTSEFNMMTVRARYSGSIIHSQNIYREKGKWRRADSGSVVPTNAKAEYSNTQIAGKVNSSNYKYHEWIELEK